MSSKRYTDEFKIEAVKQVTERGFSVGEVARRLGVTTHSLYAWQVRRLRRCAGVAQARTRGSPRSSSC
jgi:transposase